MPSPQIAGEHAHFRREPFDKDGREYFDGEDNKDSIKSISRWPQCLSTNRPFINQVTKHVVTPPPVVMQRQVPQVQTALNTVEAPAAQFVGRVVDVSATMQARQVTKEVEIPQTYLIDHVVDVPVVMLRQVFQVQTVLNTQFVGREVEVPVITQVRQVTKQVESPRREC